MIPQQLPSAFELVAAASEDRKYLVISRAEPPSPIEQLFPEGSSVEWLCHVRTVDDLVAVDDADLGIVFDQLEHMEKGEGVHLLSRLRDRYCRRVLLHLESAELADRELLALGYLEQHNPTGKGQFFLFDPDLFFERREWNSSDKWANPENFKKYRW